VVSTGFAQNFAVKRWRGGRWGDMNIGGIYFILVTMSLWIYA